MIERYFLGVQESMMDKGLFERLQKGGDMQATKIWQQLLFSIQKNANKKPTTPKL